MIANIFNLFFSYLSHGSIRLHVPRSARSKSFSRRHECPGAHWRFAGCANASVSFSWRSSVARRTRQRQRRKQSPFQSLGEKPHVRSRSSFADRSLPTACTGSNTPFSPRSPRSDAWQPFLLAVSSCHITSSKHSPKEVEIIVGSNAGPTLCSGSCNDTMLPVVVARSSPIRILISQSKLILMTYPKKVREISSPPYPHLTLMAWTILID